MTTVVVGPVIDALGAGGLPATVRISLVDALDTEVQGLSLHGAPIVARRQWDLAAGEALHIEMVPQTAIARPAGAPTWYRIAIRIGGHSEVYRVQVPESPVPLDLIALLGAEAAPAPLAAELLARVVALEANQLPPPGPAGQILVSDGAHWNAQDELPIQ